MIPKFQLREVCLWCARCNTNPMRWVNRLLSNNNDISLWRARPGQADALVLSQYTSITLPFPIVFNGGWSSMSLYIEKGLLESWPLLLSQAWRRKVDGISIADKQTKVVKEVALTPMRLRGLAWLFIYHSYYTKSINPIYMDPDYNSPLIYWWGYCNLSIFFYQNF